MIIHNHNDVYETVIIDCCAYIDILEATGRGRECELTDCVCVELIAGAGSPLARTRHPRPSSVRSSRALEACAAWRLLHRLRRRRAFARPAIVSAAAAGWPSPV